MSPSLTLHGIEPEELLDDVFFTEGLPNLHAREDFEAIIEPRYRHIAVQLAIPGSDRTDLETPWGYGGPVAASDDALVTGLARWRERQRAAGRVAEFIRFHPFINPMALYGRIDMLRFNRLTVVVRLDEATEQRWKRYSDSTRNSIRKAERLLTVRPLRAGEWMLFKQLYEAGLERNAASTAYYLDEEYFRALFAQPWCRAWVAEDGDGPVAASCFLHSGTALCHYHLAGGNERSRRSNALYLLLENAFHFYAAMNCRWMHLGGGRSADPGDALLAFKAKFSPLRTAFYVGGIIYDHDAYAGLGGNNGRFLCSGRLDAPPAKTSPTIFNLRPFEPARDMQDLFRLRCEPHNILWTGFGAPPDWSGFAPRITADLQAGRQLFMIESDGRPAGYAHATPADSCIETAIGIGEDFAGHGLATWALGALRARLAQDMREPTPICAWIFTDNQASIRAHEAAGFRFDAKHSERLRTRLDQTATQRCWKLEPLAAP